MASVTFRRIGEDEPEPTANAAQRTVTFSKSKQLNPLAPASERLTLRGLTPAQPQAPSKITPNMTEKEFDATWSKMSQSERKASNVAATNSLFAPQPEMTKEQRLNAALERNIQTLPPPPRANPSMLLGGLKKTVNGTGDTLLATSPMAKGFGLVDAMFNLPAKNVHEQADIRKQIENMKGDRSPEGLRKTVQLQAKAQPRNFIAEAMFKNYQPEASPITLQAQEQKAQATARLKEGKGELGKLAVDLGVGGADMATTYAISKAIGLPYIVVQGMLGGAETANQALAEGYSADKALTAGVASGGATAAIESLGGIGGNVGSKIIGKLAASTVGKAALSKAPAAALYLLKASNSVIGKILGSAGAEAIEEFTEYDAQRVLNNLILDKDTPRDVKEQLRNTLIGGVLGGAFGGASAYNGVQADKANEQQAVNNYMAQGNAIRREFTGADINPTNPALGDMFIQQARRNVQGKNQATAQPQVSSTQAQFEEVMKQAVERKAQADKNLYAVNQDLLELGGETRSFGRELYRFTASGQASLERASKVNPTDNPSINAATQLARQAGGTVDYIAEKGLVDRNSRRLDDSYVELMESIPKGKSKEFNEYAQNLHNIDRMSLEQRAIDKVQQLELEYPLFADPEIVTDLKRIAETGKGEGVYAKEYLDNLDLYTETVKTANATKNKPVFGQVVKNELPDGTTEQLLGGRTAEQSAQIVADLDKANPELRKTIDRIEEWWDKFGKAWYVDSGLVSEASYRAMREMYPYYVPTHRVGKQQGGSGMFGRNISTPKVVKGATGGVSPIIPMEESFMAQVNRVVKAARRNELGQSMLQFAETSPQEAARSGIRLSKENGGKVQVSDIDGYLDKVDTETLRQLDTGGYQFTVLVEGEPVNLDISGEVFESLKWLQDNGMSESWMKAAANAGKLATGWSKQFITGISGVFAATNVMRDMSTYAINSSASQRPVQLASNYGKAIKDLLAPSVNAVFKKNWDTSTLDAYQALGGNRSGFYGSQSGFAGSFPKPFKQQTTPQKISTVVGNTVGLPFKAFGKVGEFTEQIPRMAEFRNVLDKYGDTPEGLRRAAEAAADVTVNFSRSAPLTKALDSWTMYLNAAVQGLDRTARQIKNRPMATASSVFATVFLPEFLLYLINRENPYYEELDDRTKDNYYIIPRFGSKDSDGHAKEFIKLPKSREYGALFAASFDRTMRGFETGDWEEAFKGYGNTVKTSLLPPNPVTDTYFAPLAINIPSNRDFAGREIVPSALQDLSPHLQYDANTSGFAKKVGETLKVSPKKVDYLLSSFTGYPGQVLQGATSQYNKGRNPIETAANALYSAAVQPFERRFTADPLYNSRSVNSLYDQISKAQTAAADANKIDEIDSRVVTPDERRASYLLESAKELSALRKQEKEIMTSAGSMQEKQRLVGEVRKEMQQTAKHALDTVDAHVAEYERSYNPITSHLNESTRAKISAAGMSAQNFVKAHDATSGVTKKDERVAAVKSAGFSEGQARRFLTAMYGYKWE